MLSKILPVFLIFLLLTLGCASTETIESTKVSPSEIYQGYYIEGSKNGTKISATFRVGSASGSTIDLDAPAKVEHNGIEMTEIAPGFWKGTDYQLAASQFIANHQFVYTDGGGKVWQNEISLDPLEIATQNLTVSKSGGGTITFSRPVGKDENVDLSIESTKNPPVESNANSGNKAPDVIYATGLQVRFDSSRTSVSIEPFSLKKFVDGKAYISMTVKKNKSVRQSAKGGTLVISYQSQKVSVNMVD